MASRTSSDSPSSTTLTAAAPAMLSLSTWEKM
jgi:hypothetical protein